MTSDRPNARACAPVARLLDIGELEAQAVLLMAGGAHLTTRALQTQFDLSPGGATAFRHRLERELLVCGEPDPDAPGETRLRLSDGARRELEAAFAGSSTRCCGSLPS